VKLKDKKALVTGGGRGIGKAIAMAFALEGADVIVSARSEDQLAETVKLIEATGRKGIAVKVDMSRREMLQPFVKEVSSHFPVLDILVNNAGIGSAMRARYIADFEDDYWDETIEINLTVPYLLTKAFLPAMIKAGWGRIINISSMAGKTGMPTGAAYCASKHGLIGLTRTAAEEAAATGVTVNAICPGPTNTPMMDERFKASAELFGTTVEHLKATVNPMKRIIEPEEVADLAVFLAAETGRGITGQSWNISGGAMIH